MSSTDEPALTMNVEEETFDWSEDVSTFGDRLARAREYGRMDQAQLARRLGVKLSTVRNWEADRSEPRANKLQMMSGLLNVTIVWLMTGQGEGIPDVVEDAGDASDDLRSIINELRELRVAQSKLADRAGRIEKKLRTLIQSY